MISFFEFYLFAHSSKIKSNLATSIMNSSSASCISPYYYFLSLSALISSKYYLLSSWHSESDLFSFWSFFNLSCLYSFNAYLTFEAYSYFLYKATYFCYLLNWNFWSSSWFLTKSILFYIYESPWLWFIGRLIESETFNFYFWNSFSIFEFFLFLNLLIKENTYFWWISVF